MVTRKKFGATLGRSSKATSQLSYPPDYLLTCPYLLAWVVISRVALNPSGGSEQRSGQRRKPPTPFSLFAISYLTPILTLPPIRATRWSTGWGHPTLPAYSNFLVRLELPPRLPPTPRHYETTSTT